MITEGNETTEICISTSVPVDFDLDVFVVAIPLTASCKMQKLINC